MSNTVTIYTDGACRPNPGPGGWGAILHIEGTKKPRRLSGGAADTTNNRMELTAPTRALAALPGPHKVVIHTDSKYVQNGITKWIFGWQRNGWKTADKSPVKNKDLWQELAQELGRHEVEWKWVKGHAGNEWNEAVDELASAAVGKPDTQSKALPDHNVYLYIAASLRDEMGGWCALMSYQNRRKLLSGAEPADDLTPLYLRAAESAFSALRKPLPVVVIGCQQLGSENAELTALIARHEVSWSAEAGSNSEELRSAKEMARHAARLVSPPNP
ncbi:MAG: ribonuclease HI [Rhodothermales bacterium]|jgi:ribonuclease HI